MCCPIFYDGREQYPRVLLGRRKMNKMRKKEIYDVVLSVISRLCKPSLLHCLKKIFTPIDDPKLGRKSRKSRKQMAAKLAGY